MSDLFSPDLDWKPGWRPSNGTEGRLFMHNWCESCVHDAAARDDRHEEGCDLIRRSLMGEHLEEWHDAQAPEGWFVQRCTKYLSEIV